MNVLAYCNSHWILLHAFPTFPSTEHHVSEWRRSRRNDALLLVGELLQLTTSVKIRVRVFWVVFFFSLFLGCSPWQGDLTYQVHSFIGRLLIYYCSSCMLTACVAVPLLWTAWEVFTMRMCAGWRLMTMYQTVWYHYAATQHKTPIYLWFSLSKLNALVT